MAKAGDRVRFLNEVGGGTITKIEGKTVYVEDENGFETPMLLKDIVVVAPAGHQTQGVKAGLMFDQAAFDAGRKEPVPASEPSAPAAPQPLPPAEETPHGEKLNIALVFEPTDLKHLSSSSFDAVLVNDSNYRLTFSFMRRADGDRGWTVVYSGDVEPNELIDLDRYTYETLLQIERVAFQCIAVKPSKPFTLKAPVSICRKLNLTKFHKLHCFRPGIYFDTPVIEIPLVKDDLVKKPLEADAEAMRASMMEKGPGKEALLQLKGKYGGDKGHAKKPADPAANPHKLLPPIEIDLHIGELTDTTAGMQPADMLAMQLGAVEKTMNAHSRRIGQKIIFIHGKGEGVLRDAVRKLLHRRWPKAELQDASFQEYGFGATLVTIH